MFQSKRQLRKEKIKLRVKVLIFGLFLLLIFFLIIEYIYLNFSLGRTTYLSPIAKDNLSKTGDLEKTLEKSNISFSNINASSDGSFVVKLKNDGVVILSSKKDIGSQISSLQLVLSRLTIEGKKLKTLDLRFDIPVVSF